jgi:hypothetical protein
LSAPVSDYKVRAAACSNFPEGERMRPEACRKDEPVKINPAPGAHDPKRK